MADIKAAGRCNSLQRDRLLEPDPAGRERRIGGGRLAYSLSASRGLGSFTLTELVETWQLANRRSCKWIWWSRSPLHSKGHIG